MAPTFASAVVGNSSGFSRNEATVDWARRTNGATQTFRRPSHTTTPSGSTTQAHSRDTSGATTSQVLNPSGAYVPPHAQSGKSSHAVDGRYSRGQLLEIYRDRKDSQDLKADISNLYVGAWEPNLSNGAGGPVWGRRDDHGSQSQIGVDMCWDKDGSIAPLALTDMTELERENFTTSVNSPIKPPTQNASKEGTPKEGLSLRKTSISHAQGGGNPYGVSSPTTNRPGNRRRETNDAYPFPSNNLASPATARFSREESNTVTPPPALIRRRTDFKEPVAPGTTEERDKDKGATDNAGPFANLKRTTTAPFVTSSNTGNWPANSPSTAFSPMGAFGSFPAGATDKKAGYGSVRGESRFKGLMSKASTEDMDKAAREKTSLGNLGKPSQAEPHKSTQSWMESRMARPTSDDMDDLPDDVPRSGSAALHGGQDASPPNSQGYAPFTTPHKRDPREEGFGAFGMTANNTGLRDIFHGGEPFQQTPQRGGHSGQEPMSPTDTNPYQSPAHERTDNEDEESDGDHASQQFPGMGSFPVDTSVGPGPHGNPFGGFGGLGRVPQPYEVAASDRSQTSSVGPSRGVGPLPGLGSLPGLGTSAWAPNQQPTIGTPVRERGLGAFDMFGPGGGDAQSPSLAGLGNSSFYGGGGGLAGMGSIGRSSRLGSLLPTAMQEQMRQGENRSSTDEGSQGDRLHSLTGSFGRGAFGTQASGGGIPTRDTASPLRRGMFDAFSGAHGGPDEAKRDGNDPVGSAFGPVQSSAASQPSMFSTAQANLNQVRTALPTSQAHNVISPAGQPPAPQQRTMVMPDRMRWMYRDPEGKTRGPFSGLEMHDWYKAGFFSPELLVKKYEEPDYEPLAQLIRRIGNSREPFLVPQIGIPHGPPTTQPGNTWAGTSLAGAPSAAQPPFANNFPTFGTTLTAEQQNALERRKQEEQYLMARQKEHLAAQQQALAKQAQMGIGHAILPHQLQHAPSAHSLHSQPSYGSITSPGGYQPSPTQGPLTGGPAPVPGVFDNAFRAAPVPGLAPIGPGMDMLGNIREGDASAMIERLNLGRTGQQPLGTALLPLGPQHPESNAHVQQVVSMLGDRARLQREQSEHDKGQRAPHIEQQAAQASADRFQQFQELRVQTDLNIGAQAPPPEGVIGKPAPPAVEHQDQRQESAPASPPTKPQPVASAPEAPPKTDSPSLTEQVQKAASAKQATPVQPPWAKVEPAIQPFPPPLSQSPLPAPAAQRKPIVADNLAGESRSRSETPSADTPSASIAPWAKEHTEAPKGPSLKEIQEAEARKAAEREALAQAARREAAEKEALAQAQSPAAQPGLPSTSTWASGASPLTPVSAGQSAWAKPVVGKPSGQQGSSTKKTLQQIQKEEEARKQRAAAAAATATTASYSVSSVASPGLSSGKRYADLAGKQTSATPNVAGSSAWTTVGSGGKVKNPVAAPASPAIRAASTGITPAAAPKKPAVTRSTTMGGQLAKVNAEEEFRKWAVGELRPDLNKGINAEDFVNSLLSFPPDIQLITESVHSSSSTLDSRHFAEEFLRRRKLADKGIVDTTSTASPSDAKGAGGGWNEVAKKGQSTQQHQSTLDSGNFKVVAAKKKPGKR